MLGRSALSSLLFGGLGFGALGGSVALAASWPCFFWLGVLPAWLVLGLAFCLPCRAARRRARVAARLRAWRRRRSVPSRAARFAAWWRRSRP